MMARLHDTFTRGATALALLWPIGGAATAQTTTEIEHQGVRRSYILVNSEASAESPRPLLVVLHGRREATASNRSSPSLDGLARKEGFVVAYPAGLAGRWNYHQQTPDLVPTVGKDGSLLVMPDRAQQPADDIGFIRALMDVLVAERIADPKRIYASGASNGGLLTYGLMCFAADRIAAAAPLIANMSEAQIVACKPVRPVPAIFIAGTDDRIMLYDGMIGLLGGRLTSIPETIEFWRRLHGCRSQFVARTDGSVSADGTSWSKIDWVHCGPADSGAYLRFYRIDGGGHTLPSRVPQSQQEQAKNGRRSTALETSEVVWDFLKQWSLP